MNKLLLIAFITLLSIGRAVSQNAELTGTIHDAETKEILPNTSVKYDKGKGVLSDAAGKYKISVPAGEYDLVINYTGYKTLKQNLLQILQRANALSGYVFLLHFSEAAY